jgi:F-type H+-transporting ATPase subunit a
LIRLFLLLTLTIEYAFAAGGSDFFIEFVNWYKLILTGLGLTPEQAKFWMPVFGSSLVFTVLLILGISFKRQMEALDSDIAPPEHFGIRAFFETLLEAVHGLATDIIGTHFAEKFYPLLCSLFLFILFANLSGLVPGFPPPTENLGTNLAMGFIVFFVYNYYGLKENGMDYIKHFFGPMLAIAPLIFVIEVVSHLVRPLSLSVRLFGNIFGDHLVLTVFTSISYIILPAFLLFFGLMVAMIQSFVFTLLSSIYISLAVSHDH